MPKYKYVLEENDSDNEEETENKEIRVENNHIYFYVYINKETILDLNINLKKLSDKLLIYSIQNDCKPAPIYLHINSDGGEIFAALSTVDTIRNLKVPVYSIIEGSAASAATLISVVCEKRFITKHSHMLIHQLSSGFWGKMNEIEDEMRNLNRLMKVLMDIYSEYTNIKQSKLKKVLKKDLWWDSDLCMEYGLVDEIIL